MNQSGKLVRDRIPEILKQKGKTVTSRVLDGIEYKNALKEKLLEEALEVQNSTTTDTLCEELADVLEVVYALADLYDISKESLETKRQDKLASHGGFITRTYSLFHP